MLNESVSEPLTAVAFLDGRPGHEKQTLAVLSALEAVTPMAVRRVRLPKRSFPRMAANWMRFVAGFKMPACDESANRPADLVIGTGTYTHIPVLIHKRHFKSRGVTCMLPDSFLAKRFDLCMVPFHDRPAAAPNIFETMGPPCLMQNRGVHDPLRNLLLVGGKDEKSHYWRLDVLKRQVAVLVSADPHVKWIVSSSPRTPDSTVDWLFAFAAENPTVTVYRSSETPAGWIESMYAACGAVWVTADSMSMIYEALTAGCAVGVLPVDWKKPDNKYRHSIERLTRDGRVTPYRKWRQGLPMQKMVRPLNEAGRCAEEILRRWWPQRLR